MNTHKNLRKLVQICDTDKYGRFNQYFDMFLFGKIYF